MKSFSRILVVLLSALPLLVACNDAAEGEKVEAGSGKITYNSSTEEIISAFCQSDEDTTILYFSPDEVTPATLEESRYYIKITFDTAQINDDNLDPVKGGALVEVFDFERGLKLKAISGTVTIRGSARTDTYNILLDIALNDESSAVSASFKGGCQNIGAITYANEWIYFHQNAGALDSVIRSAYIDTREMNMWHIYLVPVNNITFEEIFYFSPVKISVPVDFPLDGAKYLFSESTDISIEYRSDVWNATNAPRGGIRATFEINPNIFTIRFTTNGKLRGAYSGPIEIIE